MNTPTLQYFELSDYIRAARRRRPWAILAFAAVMAVTIFLALANPTYRSTGTVLVEGQEIPEEFVRSTVTSYLDERIQIISQKVLTNENLAEIIAKYDLYPEHADAPREDVVDRMRDAIFLETVQVDTLDERRGRTVAVTIAFSVAFEYGSPEVTKSVAQDLIDLYLKYNEESRTALATETTRFLRQEASTVESRIGELEKRMGEFKAQHGTALPELAEFNLDQLGEANRKYEELEREIRLLRERRNLLRAQLSATSPNALVYGQDGRELLSDSDQLKLLQAEYLQLLSRYSAEHPNARRVKREIALLEERTGETASVGRDVLLSQLNQHNLELNALRQRYSAEHPDVIRLERMVAEIETQLQNQRPTSSGARSSAPDNPAYVQLEIQLTSAEREIAALEQTRQQLLDAIQTYQSRIAEQPQVEAEWQNLQRDYEFETQGYREIRQQLADALRALSLESAQKGERFILVDRPTTPNAPISPNRPIVLFVGILFAVLAAVGAVVLLETIERYIADERELKLLMEPPLVGTIPYISNSVDEARARLRRNFSLATGSVAVVGVLVLVVLL